MRNLQTASLVLLLFVVAVPVLAASSESAPATPASGDHAIGLSVLGAPALGAPLARAVAYTPAKLGGSTSRIPSYFYGYCSQDCTPCYSGNPYPQCPPDRFDGGPQSCLPFQGC